VSGVLPCPVARHVDSGSGGRVGSTQAVAGEGVGEGVGRVRWPRSSGPETRRGRGLDAPASARRRRDRPGCPSSGPALGCFRLFRALC
jgi:hypothetical protein